MKDYKEMSIWGAVEKLREMAAKLEIDRETRRQFSLQLDFMVGMIKTLLSPTDAKTWYQLMECISDHIGQIADENWRNSITECYNELYTMLEGYVKDVDTLGTDDARFCPGGPRMLPNP